MKNFFWRKVYLWAAVGFSWNGAWRTGQPWTTRSDTFLQEMFSLSSFFFVLPPLTLIVRWIDDDGTVDADRLLLLTGHCAAGRRSGETGTRAPSGIIDALPQRLQSIHMHHLRERETQMDYTTAIGAGSHYATRYRCRDCYDDADDGADEAAKAAQFHLMEKQVFSFRKMFILWQIDKWWRNTQRLLLLSMILREEGNRTGRARGSKVALVVGVVVF